MNARSATVWDLFSRAVDQSPSAAFIRTATGDLTYEDAAERAGRVAGGLAAMGVGRGGRVVLMASNREESVLLGLACLKLGAVFAPLNLGFTPRQLGGLLRAINPAVAVAETALVPALGAGLAQADIDARIVRLEDARPGEEWLALERSPTGPEPSPGAPRDLAAVLCTSGTTGPSKAVGLSHRWFTKLCENTERYWGFRDDDVFYCPLPLYHMDGLAMTVVPAMYHATTAAIGKRFSVRGFWEEVRRFDATVFDFLGSTLTLLWKADPSPGDGSNPARLGWGVPMPDFASSFESRFQLSLADCYGSTDVGIPAYSIPGHHGPRGSCGQVADGYELGILSEIGTPLPPDEPGEIAVRPSEPHIISEGFLGSTNADVGSEGAGWRCTGDAGRIDEAGYLYFEGRLIDVIRRRGENVSAEELEQLILGHPDVADVAAIGVPSDLTEEDIKVIAVPRPGSRLDPQALSRWLGECVPRFMHVRYIEVAASLPRTPTQKIKKTELRAAWRNPATWDADEANNAAATQ